MIIYLRKQHLQNVNTTQYYLIIYTQILHIAQDIVFTKHIMWFQICTFLLTFKIIYLLSTPNDYLKYHNPNILFLSLDFTLQYASQKHASSIKVLFFNMCVNLLNDLSPFAAIIICFLSPPPKYKTPSNSPSVLLLHGRHNSGVLCLAFMIVAMLCLFLHMSSSFAVHVLVY